MPYNGYVRRNVDTIDSIAASYTDFTASLVTSTFEALIDSNLRQIEAYNDMVSAMSKDLTTYINETTDEVADEQVLQYLELLPLHQAGVVQPENEVGISYSEAGQPQVIEVTPEGTPVNTFDVQNLGRAIIGDTAGNGLVANAVATVQDAVRLPDSTGTAFDTLTQLETQINGTPTAESLNTLIFQAVAQRIAANKYALLETMVRLGFMRLVVDNGVIETNLDLSFTEVDQFSVSQRNRIRDQRNRRSDSRSSPSFASFLFRRRMTRRDQSRHLRLEVSNRNKKVSNRNSGQVNMQGMVRIEFSTDYQPLSEE